MLHWSDKGSSGRQSLAHCMSLWRACEKLYCPETESDNVGQWLSG